MLKKAYVQMFVKLAIYTKFDICTFAYKFLQGLLWRGFGFLGASVVL